VQIQNQAPAERSKLVNVWRAPEMLDHAQIIGIALRGRGHLCIEAGKAIDQGRRAADKPFQIPKQLDSRSPRMKWKVDYFEPADQPGRQVIAGPGRPAFAKENGVYRVMLRQVMENRSGAQRPSADQRVRRFGRKEQRRWFSINGHFG
jgi:hypothetical protein